MISPVCSAQDSNVDVCAERGPRRSGLSVKVNRIFCSRQICRLRPANMQLALPISSAKSCGHRGSEGYVNLGQPACCS
jgi:hypothetical protein